MVTFLLLLIHFSKTEQEANPGELQAKDLLEGNGKAGRGADQDGGLDNGV